MINTERNAQSLLLPDGKRVEAKYEGDVFKGFFEGKNAISGIRKFFCIQSMSNPDHVIFMGDRILDQVYYNLFLCV